VGVTNELIKDSIKYTRKVLSGRRDYNLLSSSTFYLYSNYLSKLSMYLLSKDLEGESLDSLIATVFDWSSNGNIYAENSLKKIYLSVLFLITDILK